MVSIPLDTAHFSLMLLGINRSGLIGEYDCNPTFVSVILVNQCMRLAITSLGFVGVLSLLIVGLPLLRTLQFKCLTGLELAIMDRPSAGAAMVKNANNIRQAVEQHEHNPWTAQ